MRRIGGGSILHLGVLYDNGNAKQRYTLHTQIELDRVR